MDYLSTRKKSFVHKSFLNVKLKVPETDLLISKLNRSKTNENKVMRQTIFVPKAAKI